MSAYHVYILECSDGSYYTGIAKNLTNRLSIHESGKGSRYVASRLPFKLVYTEISDSRSAALKKEYAIKQMKRRQKAGLVAGIVE